MLKEKLLKQCIFQLQQSSYHSEEITAELCEILGCSEEELDQAFSQLGKEYKVELEGEEA